LGAMEIDVITSAIAKEFEKGKKRTTIRMPVLKEKAIDKLSSREILSLISEILGNSYWAAFALMVYEKCGKSLVELLENYPEMFPTVLQDIIQITETSINDNCFYFTN